MTCSKVAVKALPAFHCLRPLLQRLRYSYSVLQSRAAQIRHCRPTAAPDDQSRDPVPPCPAGTSLSHSQTPRDQRTGAASRPHRRLLDLSALVTLQSCFAIEAMASSLGITISSIVGGQSVWDGREHADLRLDELSRRKQECPETDRPIDRDLERDCAVSEHLRRKQKPRRHLTSQMEIGSCRSTFRGQQTGKCGAQRSHDAYRHIEACCLGVQMKRVSVTDRQ